MSLYFDDGDAIDYLQKRGYRVLKVAHLEVDLIKTIKDLVDYFYARRLFYNPDRMLPNSRNFKEDTKFIHGFVKKRQQLGLGKKAALQEAAMLIDALFKFEEYLKLREPVMSPRILQVDSIMDRICSYANGEVAEVGEAETIRFIDDINRLYSKKFAQRDSDRAAQSRQSILERLRSLNEQRHGNT